MATDPYADIDAIRQRQEKAEAMKKGHEAAAESSNASIVQIAAGSRMVDGSNVFDGLLEEARERAGVVDYYRDTALGTDGKTTGSQVDAYLKRGTTSRDGGKLKTDREEAEDHSKNAMQEAHGAAEMQKASPPLEGDPQKQQLGKELWDYREQMASYQQEHSEYEREKRQEKLSGQEERAAQDPMGAQPLQMPAMPELSPMWKELVAQVAMERAVGVEKTEENGVDKFAHLNNWAQSLPAEGRGALLEAGVARRSSLRGIERGDRELRDCASDEAEVVELHPEAMGYRQMVKPSLEAELDVPMAAAVRGPESEARMGKAQGSAGQLQGAEALSEPEISFAARMDGKLSNMEAAAHEVTLAAEPQAASIDDGLSPAARQERKPEDFEITPEKHAQFQNGAGADLYKMARERVAEQRKAGAEQGPVETQAKAEKAREDAKAFLGAEIKIGKASFSEKLLARRQQNEQ